MVLVLIIAMALGKLPTNMIGPIAVLVIFGNLFHFIGTKIPIVKSYLGGGSVFAIFASAAIATFGILPEYVVKSTENFVSNMGFLDFYIAALITGSILGMNRNLLMKASVRFPSPRSPFSINLPLPLNFGIDCPARATNAAPMIARTFVIAVAGIRREMIEEASVPKKFA